MSEMVRYVTVRVVVDIQDKTLTAEDVFDNMDYSFECSEEQGATVVETEIVEYEEA